jgi:hypothetical protein
MYDLSGSAEPVQSVAVLVEQSDKPFCMEQGSAKVQRYQPWQALYIRGNRKNQKDKKMVGKCRTNGLLVKKVAEIYNWLDSQVESHKDLAGRCEACGRCCDFVKGFDHKLFVTCPELMYLSVNLQGENVKPMKTSRCPYNVDGKCTIYVHRFAGCRIFCCKGDTDFQNILSESALEKFKSLCNEFQIGYRYSELATALNSFGG